MCCVKLGTAEVGQAVYLWVKVKHLNASMLCWRLMARCSKDWNDEVGGVVVGAAMRPRSLEWWVGGKRKENKGK